MWILARDSTGQIMNKAIPPFCYRHEFIWYIVRLKFYGRVVSGLLFTCDFMAVWFQVGYSLSFMAVWSQVCCSLEVLWPYGIRSIVHLRFYGRVVSGRLFTKFYGRMVSRLLFIWSFMAVWSQVCCSFEVLWPCGLRSEIRQNISIPVDSRYYTSGFLVVYQWILGSLPVDSRSYSTGF